MLADGLGLDAPCEAADVQTDRKDPSSVRQAKQKGGKIQNTHKERVRASWDREAGTRTYCIIPRSPQRQQQLG